MERKVNLKSLGVRVALLKRGLTFADVAREIGVSRKTVSAVAQGKRRNDDVERYLALRSGVKGDDRGRR